MSEDEHDVEAVLASAAAVTSTRKDSNIDDVFESPTAEPSAPNEDVENQQAGAEHGVVDEESLAMALAGDGNVAEIDEDIPTMLAKDPEEDPDLIRARKMAQRAEYEQHVRSGEIDTNREDSEQHGAPRPKGSKAKKKPLRHQPRYRAAQYQASSRSTTQQFYLCLIALAGIFFAITLVAFVTSLEVLATLLGFYLSVKDDVPLVVHPKQYIPGAGQ